MKALLRAPAGAAGAGCVYLLMCCRLFTATPQRGCCSYRYEKELQTAEDQFDMNGFYGSDYYVKSGSGTICLSQTGKVNDVKLSFKYGHNQFGPAVSVSYPWGVSFGLDGAETIFQPDEIVYNDFATVK